MKRVALLATVGVMVFVLSSCFALQGFVIADGSLSVGQSTQARFTVRPNAPGGGANYYQFFLVGRSSADISVGKGVWGTNGNFGGPVNLSTEGALAQALNDSADCNSIGGMDFSAVFGSLTWKGFATQGLVGGNVNKTATVDIKLKVPASSGGDVVVTVMGITGAWDDDDDDGVPESTDSFYCTGNATTSVYVKTA